MLTDGRRTDDGVTGKLLAHPWAFGSGELKIELWIKEGACGKRRLVWAFIAAVKALVKQHSPDPLYGPTIYSLVFLFFLAVFSVILVFPGN